MPFSPEIHSDDKVCNIADLQKLIDNNTEIIITEKLDGGNTCFASDGIYARSHSQETSCPTFDYIKNVYYSPNKHELKNKKVFGENMFAIHSIEYTNLKNYFYAFNILQTDIGRYMSWDSVLDWCINHNIETIPVIYEGKIESLKWLEIFLASELKKESALGGKREGFVVRIRKSFHFEDFDKVVFKYVREGHVQTDEHWSKNWKQAKLVK